MKRNIFCGMLAALFLLTGMAAYAETMADIQAHKDCKYCGMDREKFAHSRMLVEYRGWVQFWRLRPPLRGPRSGQALISSPRLSWWRITIRKI